METEIVYAVALILQQVSETAFQLMTEPVKMAMDQCLEMAKEMNMDNSHPYVMACLPFTEPTITQ